MRTIRLDGFTLLLAALGVLGTALVLLREATYGVGLGVDSTAYLSTAQNLLEGKGFVQWNSAIYQDGAPFFPLALAFVAIFGVDVIDAAGYVNSAAFGLTIFTTTLWLRSRIKSHFLVIWAGCICALSLPLADLSAKAMTEPLFILFVVLSLFALDRCLETGKRGFLFTAAVCAAVVCLTRYIGVTIVTSALLLLMLQRDTTLLQKIRNAATYSVIALTPIGAWMLRNFLNTGSLTGRSYPTGFSLLGSLHITTDEFFRWVFGDVGFKYLDIGLAKISGITIGGGPSVTGVWLKITVLLALAIGVGYALIRLRPKGYSSNWGTLAVPAVFVSVYALFLAIVLPLTDIQPPRRYLTPLYVPALVAAMLLLNEFLRSTSDMRLFITLQRLRKSNEIAGGRVTVSVSVLILICFLSLWLPQQVLANYHNIKYWVDNGYGYASRQWTESEILGYIKAHPPLAGRVWTTAERAMYLLLADGRAEYRQLPASLPDSWPQRVSRVHADGKDAYFVWFYTQNYSWFNYVAQYGLEEIITLPGMEVVAALSDGIILKARKNARPVIRADFDVYMNEDASWLTYVRDECEDGDIDPKFFLHIDPVDHADLPDHRQQYTFDNLDFRFAEHGFRGGGRCVAVRDLPAYDIVEIRTGQYTRVEGGFERVWQGSFDVAGQTGR